MCPSGSPSFIARANAWVASDREKLQAARIRKAAEEADWREDLLKADRLAPRAEGGLARLAQLRNRNWT
jgi:hypothetical protein